MDWMDFVFKFSSELLIVVLSITVGGLNWIFFGGGGAKSFRDESLVANFIGHHYTLNPKFYTKNNSVVTVVADNDFLPTAQAEALTGLDAQALTASDTTGNTIVMGDENSILAPNPDSITASVANVVKVYTVKSGDTLKSIAAENHISTNTIKWSNPSLLSDTVKPGYNLLIPPTDGVVVTADSNTTLADLAVKYSSQRYNNNKTVRDDAAAKLLDTIITYNGLASAEDIDAGQIVIIPGGVITEAPVIPKPAPTPKPKVPKVDNSLNAVTSVSGGYDDDNHTFPRGYCTYYVATRMKITFGGNAKNWLANAQASGYVVSKEPAPRTAVVTTDSRRWGHVAYVEEVTDTAILVSEMNFNRFNRVDQRWIPIDSPTIRGYIYP